MIKISELERLDKISLAEVEKIIDDYENLRMEVTRDFHNFCRYNDCDGKQAESYTKFKRQIVDWYVRAECKEKYLSVLEQMKVENCGGAKNV